MIDHIWSILCSQAVIDQDTNNISIHNVVEQLIIKGVPVPSGRLPIHLELISLWTRTNSEEPTEGLSRVIYAMPSGKLTNIVEPKIELLTAERARNRVVFEGLPVEESGRHYFRVEQQKDEDTWIEVASIPFTVIFSPPEEEGEKPDTA